jgi:hypothetical protein
LPSAIPRYFLLTLLAVFFTARIGLYVQKACIKIQGVFKRPAPGSLKTRSPVQNFISLLVQPNSIT